MKFLNLLTDELRRSRNFYVLLLVGVIVLEVAGIGYSLLLARNDVVKGMGKSISLANFFDGSMYYTFIVGGAAFALIIYAVFTWAREWYFQGNYIYRLLILPGNRAPIAFAKVASIIMLMAGLLVTQLIIFYLTHWVAELALADSYSSQPVLVQLAQSMGFSYIFFPLNPASTFVYYTFGLGFLIILMNNCIIIFSHRGHGLVKTSLLTIIYDVVMLGLLIGLVFSVRAPLTQSEVLIFIIVFVISYCGINSGVMYWLMNHYISV